MQGLIEKNKKTIYIKNVQKSPESTNSIPNFSEIKNPTNAENKAATPPETISQAGLREYFNFVYSFSRFKKLISNSFHSRLAAFELNWASGFTLVVVTTVVNETVENFFLKMDFFEKLRRFFKFKVVFLQYLSREQEVRYWLAQYSLI